MSPWSIWTGPPGWLGRPAWTGRPTRWRGSPATPPRRSLSCRPLPNRQRRSTRRRAAMSRGRRHDRRGRRGGAGVAVGGAVSAAGRDRLRGAGGGRLLRVLVRECARPGPVSGGGRVGGLAGRSGGRPDRGRPHRRGPAPVIARGPGPPAAAGPVAAGRRRLATWALNTAHALFVRGHLGVVAYDSLAPLLLIGWAEVGPWFLRQFRAAAGSEVSMPA